MLPDRYLELLKEQLLREEGFRAHPYMDTTGHVTIGIGRNLVDVGITLDEAMHMLTNDIHACEAQLEQYGAFIALDPVRKMVLIDLCFNLGFGGLEQFVKFWAAIRHHDYKLAGDELRNSRWYGQVKVTRAENLIRMLESGSI